MSERKRPKINVDFALENDSFSEEMRIQRQARFDSYRNRGEAAIERQAEASLANRPNEVEEPREESSTINSENNEVSRINS